MKSFQLLQHNENWQDNTTYLFEKVIIITSLVNQKMFFFIYWGPVKAGML